MFVRSAFWMGLQLTGTETTFFIQRELLPLSLRTGQCSLGTEVAQLLGIAWKAVGHGDQTATCVLGVSRESSLTEHLHGRELSEWGE